MTYGLALTIAVSFGMVVVGTLIVIVIGLCRRQEALGRACRTLADVIAGIPGQSPIVLDPETPGEPAPPSFTVDEPYTQTPTTMERWEIGRRRVEDA